MNLRRLKYFVKIVDVGSLTQAADLLHIAQPALSQQLATLEGEVHQQLLLRTKRGVTPTEAGKVLYRHAQLILRQCDQAMKTRNIRKVTWMRTAVPAMRPTVIDQPITFLRAFPDSQRMSTSRGFSPFVDVSV